MDKTLLVLVIIIGFCVMFGLILIYAEATHGPSVQGLTADEIIELLKGMTDEELKEFGHIIKHKLLITCGISYYIENHAGVWSIFNQPLDFDKAYATCLKHQERFRSLSNV